MASENVTTVEIHKVTDDGDDLADSQMSNQDIFADDDGPGITTDNFESIDRTETIKNELHPYDGGSESNPGKSDSEVVAESAEQQANNLFEKLGYGSALVEPSAEEKFDEMIRSSTPSTSLKSSNDDLLVQPSEDDDPQDTFFSNETEVLQMEGGDPIIKDSEVHVLRMFPHSSILLPVPQELKGLKFFPQ